MTKRGRNLIIVGALLVGFGPAVGWWLYKRARFASVDELVAARFKARASCPEPVLGKPSDSHAVRCDRCFDGELRPGTPEVLMLCEKYEGTTQVQRLPAPAVRYLIGLWLPPGVKVDDAWLERWRGHDDVSVAMRTSDGGAAVVWKDLPSASDVEARERALAESLGK